MRMTAKQAQAKARQQRAKLAKIGDMLRALHAESDMLRKDCREEWVWGGNGYGAPADVAGGTAYRCANMLAALRKS